MIERLRTLHKASIYAVVGFAFLALVPAGQLDTPTTVAFTVGAVASWFVDAAGWTDRSQVPWWNGLVALALVGSALQVSFTDAAILIVGIRFILLLIVVRLVTRHRVRDELQLYALAFLVMAAGTAVNEGVSYGLAFAGFVLSGTFSLALFHLTRELEEGENQTPFEEIAFDRGYVLVLAGLSACIFVASLVVFVGFPRVGLGFFQSNSRVGTAITGFSDSVEIGQHGTLRQSEEVALRVEFPDGEPDDVEGLHWRTMTFDRYDGNRWRRTLDDTVPVPESDGRYFVGNRHGSSMPEEKPENLPRTLEIYVEPLGTDILPTLWPTSTVDFGLSEGDAPPGSPRAGEVRIDNYGDLHHTVPSDIGIPYTITTRRRPDPETLRDVEADMPPEQRRLQRYLQLPDSERSVGEISALAGRITADAPTPYAKAIALRGFFRANFTYTTDLPDYDPKDPLADFLFEKRRGHCEYYATAMVLMLRTLGVPARMVNGFLGGTWNDVGGYLEVRQQDAHSWVELHLPGYDWVPIDPTPVASISGTRSELLDWIGESYDALRMTWYRWVIEYDLDRQLEMLESLRTWLGSERTSTSAGDGDSDEGNSTEGDWSPGDELVAWVGLAIIALLSVGTTRRRRGLRQLLAAAVWTGAATGWLLWFRGFDAATLAGGTAAGFAGLTAAAVGALFRRGTRGTPARLFARIERAASDELERRRGEPPARYLGRIAENRPELRDELEQFRRIYLAVRFGNRRLEESEQRELEAIVETIETGLRSGGPGEA